MLFYRASAHGLLMAGFLLLLGLGARSSSAQITYLDEIPWFAAADSTSRLAMVAEVNRFEDSTQGWSVNRLHVCAILPGGDRSVFFLRMSHLGFDTGGRSPLKRWPDIAGPQEDFQWPSETTITSFGQPEVGATGPVAVGGLTHWRYGVALGLPVGTDRLYPFASVSLPFRVALRRNFDLTRTSQLAVTGTYLMNMDSGKDLLDESAFPDGWQLGLSYSWFRGRGARLLATYDLKDLSGRKSEIVGIQSWWSWTDDGSLGLKVSRDLSGSEHRPALWYFTLAWRFDSPGRRPAAEAEAAAAR